MNTRLMTLIVAAIVSVAVMSAGPVQSASVQATTRPAVPRPAFAKGQKVEFKDNRRWDQGIVVREQNGWYMLEIGATKWKQWVEGWRIRKLKSTQDDLPPIQGHGWVEPNQPPPSVALPPKPEKSDDMSWADTRIEQAKAVAVEIDMTQQSVELDKARVVSLPKGNLTSPVIAPVADVDWPASSRVKLKTQVVATSRVGLFVSRSGVGVVGVEGSPQVEWFDLKTNRSTSTLDMSADFKLVAISESGTMLATHFAPVGASQEHVIELYSLEPGKAKKVLTIKPFEGLSWPENVVANVSLSSQGKHLFVTNGRGLCVVIDTQSGQAVWQMKEHIASEMTADARFVRVGLDGTVYFFDFATGNVAGSIVPGVASLQASVVSPNGQWLATFQARRLVLSPLASGVSKTVELGDPIQSVQWIDPSLLLINGTAIFDVSKLVFIWRFEQILPPQAMVQIGSRQVSLARDGMLTATSMLSPQVEKARTDPKIQQANQLAIKPADRVAVSFDLQVDDATRQQVIAHATQAVVASGLISDDAANIRLIYSSKPGQSRNVKFRKMSDGKEESISVTEQVNSVQLKQGEQLLWTGGWTFTGAGFVELTGKSLAESVEESRRKDLIRLGKVELPKAVFKSIGSIDVGSSKVN
jgi:hypothetical protein